MKTTRAATLAELLVASTLSFLLLGLVVTVFLLARRGWTKTYRLQTAQASCLITMARLREDFRRSRPGSTLIQGDVLSLPCYDDGSGQVAWDSSGDTVWRCWIQYRWRDHVLQRRQIPIEPASTEPGSAPAWPPGEPGHRVGLNLTRCQWSLTGSMLQCQAESQFEGAVSATHLRVLPHLYQPD